MRRCFSLFFLLILSLCAADFWQTKPYTEWNDKETQRLLNSSPWAREVDIPIGGAPGAGAPEGGRGRGGPAGDAPIPGPSIVNVVVRWQTALPVKQALAHLKFGKEVANSADAKTFLDQQETSYVIGVLGLPAMMLPGPPEPWKGMLKNRTTLSVKGKGMLAPSEVQIMADNKLVDVYFSFPRAAAVALEDKEVEFSSKIGFSAVTTKFRLKDMVLNGKLEL